jgi:dinuclear metal center YbgI/SA1388 family protein
MRRDELTACLDQLLQPGRFKDYCPNGLQVEGREEVRKLAVAVSASLEAIGQALDAGADALIVHHGWFWRGEDVRILAARRARIALALEGNLNLYGFHLPLDAHPELGNNAQLARRMGWHEEGRAGEQDLLCHGRPAESVTLDQLARRLTETLGRPAMLIPGSDGVQQIRRLAWCSGGAQDYFHDAIALGVDAFVTGEASEWNYHAARESGVAFIAAGHHATERYGVQAVGEYLESRFGLDCRFLDSANPI